MEWTLCATYGALGGLVVEAVAFHRRIAVWQEARHQARAKSRKKLPRLGKFIDAPADITVAITRLALGAGGGAAFHSQVTGALAALAVGASAPALISQLGDARTIQEAVSGARRAAPGTTGEESSVPLPNGTLVEGVEAVES